MEAFTHVVKVGTFCAVVYYWCEWKHAWERREDEEREQDSKAFLERLDKIGRRHGSASSAQM